MQDGCYWKVTPLYTAPPAPVSVPAEVSWEDVPEDITEDDMALASAWAHGFNQCRAAMLQGAEPVTTAYKLPTESAREKALAIQLLSVIKDLGLPENCPFVDVLNEIYRLQSNSPVIPDGWVACSERMPPLKTGVIVGKWIGRSWATKWATYIPSHPEANSHGFIMPGGSWEPTHWMPIPAAPQQEA
ncbi:DUF551 domain-containing protein [Enterobacter sp. 23-M-SZ-13]|uniref:DUF551 domain-containing protein n=1 Tax=unclassified Enterobacter TaxID=2608935 RepID=UPI003977B8A7